MTAMLLLLACTTPPAEPPAPTPTVSVRLTENATLILASVEQGRAALGKHDTYINTQGALERQIRLHSDKPISPDEFVKHVQQQVIPWTDEQKKRLAAVAAALAEKLAPFNVPLPAEVLLIQTTGEDESGAAYTRGNAIVFSKGRLAGRDAPLERLLAHELFHVISRHDGVLRRKLYAVVGFAPCDPIALPNDLEAVRITNPDAPMMDYYINVKHEDEMLSAVPILFSDRAEFDPKRKRLFDYLQFRLLAVHRQAGRWKPLLEGGKPILIDARANKSFREQIGDNTNYIIHPDEILADNFVHLVRRTKDLKSPEIVEKMRLVLSDD